jgi:hypothetical protein
MMTQILRLSGFAQGDRVMLDASNSDRTVAQSTGSAVITDRVDHWHVSHPVCPCCVQV